MNLKIQQGAQSSLIADTLALSTNALQFPTVHLFIASHTWDLIDIYNLNTIPTEQLKGMHAALGCIRVEPIKDLNSDNVSRLAILFPELAGQIRKCYMFRGDVNEVLRGHIIE